MKRPRRVQPSQQVSYDSQFFDEISDGSVESALVVVPILRDLLGELGSVVDVGCGTGGWLSAFAEAGVPDLLGLDGDYVTRSDLLIPETSFQVSDLTASLALGREFDLVVCLEVAEHLPVASADQLVHNLTELGSAVLFSAAIPHQGGVNHVNEQWPEYWASKFRSRGYLAFDPLRSLLWDDDRIEPWYKQNLILYLEPHRAEQTRKPLAHVDHVAPLVHPHIYLPKARRAESWERLYHRPEVRLVRKARATLRRLAGAVGEGTPGKISR